MPARVEHGPNPQPQPQQPQDVSTTAGPIIVLTDEQFDQIMVCIRQKVAERTDLNESTLAAASKIPRHGSVGLVPLGNALDLITRQDSSQANVLQDDTARGELISATKGAVPESAALDTDLPPSEKSCTDKDKQDYREEMEGSNARTDQMATRRRIFSSPRLMRGEKSVAAHELTASEKLQKIVSSLNEDTFSFVISAPIMSAPFFTGIVVFLLKTLLYALTLADLMSLNNNANVAANIPVAVHSFVVYTQILALFIAVFTQNDMVVGLKLLYEGFGRNGVGSGINDAFSHATYPKWLFAVILLFLEGLLGLLATLFLTITSTTILDVLLNFAAVEFISSLDDSAFFLASIGYLGKANRLEAEEISETSYLIPHKVKPIYQIGLLMTILVVTIASWISVAALQLQGAFALGSFYVQFDDNVRQGLGYHSGIYTLATPPISSMDFFSDRGRFRYEEITTGGGGKFDYCSMLSAWTFFIEGDDPCNNILAMADPLDTFAITDTAATPWLALREDSKFFVPMDNFYLDKVCAADDDCGQGTCTRDGLCECKEGYLGPRCDFSSEEICPRLILDESTSQNFLARRQLATSYTLLLDGEENEVVSFYDRPIYVNVDTQDEIVYTGLRWVVLNPRHGGINGHSGEASNLTFAEAVKTRLLHASTSIGLVDAISDPVYYNSAQQSSSPEGLRWYSVVNNATLDDALLGTDSLPTFLICERCDDELNPCKNGNQCVNGTCHCEHGETGSGCQILPLGNGLCNKLFNTPAYDFDQGDCCASTCTPDLNPCGSISVGDDIVRGFGYPQCVPSSVHCTGGSGCYIRASKKLSPFFPLPSYTSAIELWNNGQLALVGEEGRVSTIRITPVSDDVEDEEERLEFGALSFLFAITSPPGNIHQTNAGTIPRGALVYNQGGVSVSLDFRGSVKPTLTSQNPIFLSNYPILDGSVCPEITSLDAGASLLAVPGRRVLSLTVVLIVSDPCGNIPSTNTTQNGTTSTNSSVADFEQGAHLFFLTTSSQGWAHVPIGKADDIAVASNGLYFALHDESMGVGEQIRILDGTLHAIGIVVPLVTFSLREALSGVLDTNSTKFISLDGMQLSYDGHELSVAVSALNMTTQARFGFVAKIAVASGTTLQPIVLDPVVPVAFLDSFPAFLDHRSHIPCETSQSCDSIVFSGYGTSFAFLTDTRNDTDEINVYTTERNYGLQFGQWKFVASFFAADHGMEQIRKFALSYDGATLVVSDQKTFAKFELWRPCQENEEPLYLSIVLDNNSHSVSWSVESLFGMEGMTYVKSVVRDCAGCYPVDNEFAQSIVMEKVCVPQELVPCLGLSVEISAQSTTTSVTAFFSNNTVADPILYFEGADEGLSDNGFAKSWRSSTCANTAVRSCADSESLYVQSLSFTKLEGSMWWSMHSNSTGMTVENRTVVQQDLSAVDSSSVYSELCVPSDDCWALAFGGGMFELSYVMSVFDGREVKGSGFVMGREPPTLYLGACEKV